MKLGYSNLLGETLDASGLDYRDCRAFQIVCPACREPVFKVVRQRYGETHYLSHYAEGQEPDLGALQEEAFCELRVARLGANPAAIAAANAAARGQRLELFLSVLRSAMLLRDFASSPGVRALIAMLQRSKTTEALAQQFAAGAALIDEALFVETAHDYIHADIGPADAMWRTGFGLAAQQRIAWDVWQSLLTPAQAPLLGFAFRHAFAMLLWRLQLAFDGGAMDEAALVLRRYAETAVRCNRATGEALIREMRTTAAPQPFAAPGINYLGKLLGEVNHELIGCLLRLDYLSILRDAQQEEEQQP